MCSCSENFERLQGVLLFLKTMNFLSQTLEKNFLNMVLPVSIYILKKLKPGQRGMNLVSDFFNSFSEYGIFGAPLAIAAGFFLLYFRFKPFRELVSILLPRRRFSMLVETLDIVIEDAFTTSADISRLRLITKKDRQMTYVEEKLITIGLLLDDKFLELTREKKVGDAGNDRDKKLFEAVTTLILQESKEHFHDFIRDENLAIAEDTEFRNWIKQRMNVLQDRVRARFLELYPLSGTSVSPREIEAMVIGMKGEVRDIVFEIFFNCRDISIDVEKAVTKRREAYLQKKSKLLKNFEARL